MSDTILKDQIFSSPQRGLPVTSTASSSGVTSVSGETGQFYYWSSGVRTIDAGQAAGTLVECKLANSSILNAAGSMIGTFNDKSISFTSTAFTTEKPINFKSLEDADTLTGVARITAINAAISVGTGLANGEYVIDYRTGTLYGRKASTQTSLSSVAYKIPTQSVIVTGAGATSIAIAEDTASSAGETIVKNGAVRRDTAASSAGTDGDWATVNQDSLGHAWSREGYAPGAEDNTNGVYAMVRRAVAVSTYAPTAVQSNSFTTTNVKASAGNVYGFSVINTSGADRYLQFHNTATTPAGGATAAFKFRVPAESMLTLSENDWGGPLTFTTGIAPANSTAASTYTAGTAGDLLLDLWYK